MNLPQTGGCQCGKVRYEITQKPLLVYTCHCLDCQRLTISAFSLGVVVPEAGFRLAGIDPRPLKRSPIAGGDAKNSLACQKRASLGLDRSAGRCRRDQHTGFAYSANSCPIENLSRRHELIALPVGRQCIERGSDALGRKILREWRDVATAANERQSI